ncbi:MAG TPA: hypothetical protein VKY56_02595 [Chloroflexota bacterium]|jgi:hypothetical protein|nr:hypothetical protein [Chloroflexota bacterium]
MATLGIQEWKRTERQYVAILQSIERFEPGTIREIEKHHGQTILGGVLRGTDVTDWYALAFDRNEWEFEEARALARQALDRYRASHHLQP